MICSFNTRLLVTLIASLAVGALAAEKAVSEAAAAGEVKSPLDQSNRPEDLKITQTIRKDVVADGSLSMSAKNVQIITADGKVTLRGTVKSAEEHNKIVAHAQKSAGAAAVVNQIKVKEDQP